MLLVAAIQAGIYNRQAAIMKAQNTIATEQTYLTAAQTTIANTQADISNKQLSITQIIERPWVSVAQATPARDWTISDGKVVFSINFLLKNDGQIPATGVWVDGEMYSRGGDASSVISRAQAFCDRVQRRQPNQYNEGFTIFPSEQSSRYIVVTLSGEDLSFLQKKGDHDGFSVVMVSGCIDYISPLSKDHHRTPFVYELDKVGAHPNEWASIDVNTSAIPANQLVLLVHPLLTWNAD